MPARVCTQVEVSRLHVGNKVSWSVPVQQTLQDPDLVLTQPLELKNRIYLNTWCPLKDLNNSCIAWLASEDEIQQKAWLECQVSKSRSDKYLKCCSRGAMPAECWMPQLPRAGAISITESNHQYCTHTASKYYRIPLGILPRATSTQPILHFQYSAISITGQAASWVEHALSHWRPCLGRCISWNSEVTKLHNAILSGPPHTRIVSQVQIQRQVFLRHTLDKMRVWTHHPHHWWVISIMRELCRSGCVLSENPRGVERPTAFQCEKFQGYIVHHMCEHWTRWVKVKDNIFYNVRKSEKYERDIHHTCEHVKRWKSKD